MLRMKSRAVPMAVLCALLLTAVSARSHQIIQITDSTADSHSCRVAASFENVFVVAWVEEGSGVWTRTVLGDAPQEPVFHGPGRNPDLDWYAGIGFVLVWWENDVIALRESCEACPQGWSDQFSNYGPAEGVDVRPRVSSFHSGMWVHGCMVTWTSSEQHVYFLETEQGIWGQPVRLFEGGDPGDAYLAEAVHRDPDQLSTARVFFMGWEGLSYIDRESGVWGGPTVLHPDLSDFGGEFAVAAGRDGMQHLLSNGPPPTCPCNVITYSHGTSAADWSLPEDLTYYYDYFSWPQDPAIGVDQQGDPHLVWFQQHYGANMEPSFAGSFWREKTAAGWEDHGDEFQSHFGSDTDIHVGLAEQSALVWAETYGAEHNIWAALAPHVTAAETVPRAGLSLRAHPNPFNPRTTLGIALSRNTTLRLVVTGVDGRVLRTLAGGRFPAGERVFEWDGRDDAGRELPSGVYLAQAATDYGLAHEKLVLLR